MKKLTFIIFLLSMIFGTECMAQCSPQGINPRITPHVYMSDGSVLSTLFDEETQTVDFSLDAADSDSTFDVYIYRNGVVYKTITVTDLSVESFYLGGARVGTYTFYVDDNGTLLYIGTRTKSFDGGTFTP